MEIDLHLFAPDQPDLNWDNPAVREAMHDIMRFWLDKGIDGFKVKAQLNSELIRQLIQLTAGCYEYGLESPRPPRCSSHEAMVGDPTWRADVSQRV